MQTFEIEYYDRENNYHGIGTFHCLNDLPIKKGDKFIVPSADLLEGTSTSNRKNWVGCCEGRNNHPAYLKPILLSCKGISDHHIITSNGSFRKDLVYVESE
jgi:hypothetical protein